MIRYAVYICGNLVCYVEAEKAWSKEHHITSEDELKRDYVRIEREGLVVGPPVIRLFAYKTI